MIAPRGNGTLSSLIRSVTIRLLGSIDLAICGCPLRHEALTEPTFSCRHMKRVTRITTVHGIHAEKSYLNFTVFQIE